MRERTPFPGELVRRLPNLKMLLTTGRRNLALDLEAFKERGIPVFGAGASLGSGASALPDSTTEHIVTSILAIAKNIASDDAIVKDGGWQTRLNTGVAGKTLGLVGLGRLGASVAKIFRIAFGTKIIAWSENLTQEKADEQAKHLGLATETDGEKTFKSVSREELFSTADFISVHLVLSDRSRGLINAKDFAMMKPESFFINTSRGPLVVEKDLLETLKQGRIRGAALDVFNIEPLPANSEWRTTPWGKDGRSNVLLTPHTGYVEDSAIETFYKVQADILTRRNKGEDLQEWLLTRS